MIIVHRVFFPPSWYFYIPTTRKFFIHWITTTSNINIRVKIDTVSCNYNKLASYDYNTVWMIFISMIQ